MAIQAETQILTEDKPVVASRGKRPIVYWADLIRVVAIYLVVIVHVSGQLTNVWGKIPSSNGSPPISMAALHV